MTDATADVREVTPPARIPESLRRVVTPWWSARATRLGALLEAADDAGETTIELDGRRVTIEHLTEMAKQAIEMVERLEAEACT